MRGCGDAGEEGAVEEVEGGEEEGGEQDVEGCEEGADGGGGVEEGVWVGSCGAGCCGRGGGGGEEGGKEGAGGGERVGPRLGGGHGGRGGAGSKLTRRLCECSGDPRRCHDAGTLVEVKCRSPSPIDTGGRDGNNKAARTGTWRQ